MPPESAAPEPAKRAAPAPFWRESATPDGERNPAWDYLLASFERLGPSELGRRRDEAERLLREAGVTYNAREEPSRAWELDPVPLVLGSGEWEAIEAALIQRAELLNLVLADLYGPRELVRRGLVPAPLVFANPSFVRAADRIKPPGPRMLLLYAVDLVRGEDGQWRVLADRTQAPSGAGYALSNRLVLRRLLPSVFRDAQVHRLASFFRSMRATLAGLVRRRRGDPTIVMLTPGPLSETYPEQLTLAEYLGYPLVQGQDLVVRGGRVWLESLGPPRAVDVILRRLDDDYCDSLELRPDSELSVPGLVDVARQGNVVIANPLGSGVLESPGLLAYLPAIAKHLLGQPLAMESVPTAWCGEPGLALPPVAKLDDAVLKPVWRSATTHSGFPGRLDAKARQALLKQVAADPRSYVLQSLVPPSRAPSIGAGGELEERPLVMRAFLVAREDGYVVMPGGLTRIGRDAGDVRISSQAGASSKDTWVLASEPEKVVSDLPAEAPAASGATAGALLSARAAENLFWMGRYAERAEGTARLLRVALRSRDETIEAGDVIHQAALEALFRTVTHVTSAFPGFVVGTGQGAWANPEAEILSLVADPERPGSVRYALRQLAKSADAVRGRIPSDMRGVIRAAERRLEKVGAGDLASVGDDLDDIVMRLIAIAGLTHESKTRDLGWTFLDAGRRLERSVVLSALVRSLFAAKGEPAVEAILIEIALAVADSRLTYRSRYRSAVELSSALDLLLMHEENPRSLRFQLDRLRAELSGMPGRRSSTRLADEERFLLEAHSSLLLSDVAALAAPAEGEARRANLDALLGRVVQLLRRIQETLDRTVFAATAPPLALGSFMPSHPERRA